MNVETAKLILNDCVRTELRDHAFGDKEVWWFKGPIEIAFGYFGGGRAEVSLGPAFHFTNAHATALEECGTLTVVERNDETGPDSFVVGQIMPGLAKDAVRKELS